MVPLHIPYRTGDVFITGTGGKILQEAGYRSFNLVISSRKGKFWHEKTYWKTCDCSLPVSIVSFTGCTYKRGGNVDPGKLAKD